jgi:hypothetical protein
MPRNKKLENVINMFGDKGLPGPLQEQVDQYRKEQQEEREAAERRAQQEQEQREAAELEAWRARSKRLSDQLDRNVPKEGERPSDVLSRRWAEAEQAGKEAAVRHIQEREADKGVLRKGFEQFSRGVGNTLSSMGEGAVQIKEGAQSALGMETPYTSATQIYRQTPEQQMAQEIQRQSLAETTGDFASKIPGAVGSSLPYMINPSVGVSAGISSGTAAGAANVEEALKSGKMREDEYLRGVSQVAGQEVLGAAESLLGPGGAAKGGFIKSALGEGLEEGLQTVGGQALDYATDMAGERDKTMGQRAGEVAEAAALGTAVGGIVSGTTVAADTVADYVSGPSRKSATAISKMSEEDVQSLPPATQKAVKELQKSKPRSKAEREKAQAQLSEAVQKDAQAESQTPSESPVEAPVTPSEATQVESAVQPVQEAPTAPEGAPEARPPIEDSGLLNQYEARKSAKADNAATLEAGGVVRTFPEVNRSRKNVKEVPTVEALNKKFKKFEAAAEGDTSSVEFWNDMQLLAQSQQSQGKGDKLPPLVGQLRKKYGIDTKKMFPDKAARNTFETWAKLRKAELTGEPVTDVSETAHSTSTGVYVTAPSIKEVAKGSPALSKALSKKGGLQGMQGQLKDLLGFLRTSAGATGKYDPEAGAAVDLPQMIKEAVSPRLDTILKDHGMAEFSEQISRETGGKAKGKPYTEIGTGQFVIKPQNAGFAGRAYADTLLDMADRVWGDGRQDTTGDVFGTATLETRKLLKDTMVTMASDIYTQLGIAMPAFSEGSVPKGSGILQRDYAAPRQGRSGMDIASMGPVDAAIAKESQQVAIDTAKADEFVTRLLSEGMDVEDAVAIHDSLVGLPQKQELGKGGALETVRTPINDPSVGVQPKEFTSKAGGADARLDAMADRDVAIREALSSFDDAQQASLKRVLEQQLDAAVENFANSLDNPENLAKAQKELNDVSNKIERLTGIREKLNKRADRRAGKTTSQPAERTREITEKSKPDDFEKAESKKWTIRESVTFRRASATSKSSYRV